MKINTSSHEGIVKNQLLSPEEAETAAERAARLNAATNLSEESTYGELVKAALSTYRKYAVDGKLTGKVKGVRIPTVKQLLESDETILLSGKSGELEITAFANGFFCAVDTSSPEGYCTVDGIERAIRNLGAHKGSKKQLEEVMDMNWIEILAIDAQMRLDHNEEKRSSDMVDLSLRGDGMDSVSGMVVQDYATELENAEREARERDMRRTMKEKLPDALEALHCHSEKQWVAVIGRFGEMPVPYKELAAELEVNTTRVNTLMNKGLAFLKKYMSDDAELKALISATEGLTD